MPPTPSQKSSDRRRCIAGLKLKDFLVRQFSVINLSQYFFICFGHGNVYCAGYVTLWEPNVDLMSYFYSWSYDITGILYCILKLQLLYRKTIHNFRVILGIF